MARDFLCKQCGVRLEARFKTVKYVCPVCGFENDVQQARKNQLGPITHNSVHLTFKLIHC